MPDDATPGRGTETMTRAEAARAALASARLEGQPVDARTEAVLLAWGAGRLPDSALDEHVEERQRYYVSRSGGQQGRSPASGA
jgi:hypothetical protein